MPHISSPQFQQQPLSPAELLDGSRGREDLDFNRILEVLQRISMLQASETAATGGATPESDSFMDAVLGLDI